MSFEREIDADGRVSIPAELRERLGLNPGATVSVAVEDGHVVLRPEIDRGSTPERLKGCINGDTRREAASPTDPTDLADDWTSDLPSSPSRQDDRE